MTAEEILIKQDIDIDMEDYVFGKRPKILEAMKKYAKLKCEEQRAICTSNFDLDRGEWASIMNAPEPQFD